MKLAIISHTDHYKTSSGTIVGWGPTVREIDNLAPFFEKIYHVAFLHSEIAPRSALPYAAQNVEFIPLAPVGGATIADKLKIIAAVPQILKTVQGTLKQVDIFQFRAPTGIGVFIIPYLTFFSSKKGWYKYAGNWSQSNAPMSYALQRFLLRNQSRKVTVNGAWPEENKNIIAFENPCLTETEREQGEKCVEDKRLQDSYNFCFVGSLHQGKGIVEAIKAWKKLNLDKRGKFHILGGGPLENEVRKISNFDSSIVFYGHAPKEQVNSVLKKCQFIVLPSKSEGFPKVIGEAMNYGCVPIVTNVSCIGQYVKQDENGFLLDNNHPTTINDALMTALEMSNENFVEYIRFNYKLADIFTYKYYTNRVINEIIS